MRYTLDVRLEVRKRSRLETKIGENLYSDGK